MTDMVMAGAGDVTRENGYGLLIQSAGFGEIDDGLLRPLLESRVDGAILYLSGEPSSRDAYAAGSPSSATRRCSSARRATRRCLRSRRRTSTAPSSSRPPAREGPRADRLRRRAHLVADDRGALQRYRAALQAASIEPARELQLFRGPLGRGQRRRDGATLLELREPPTAIMAANDLLALGVVRTARRARPPGAGRRRDQRLQQLDFSDFVEPALTTVSIPVYEMGRAARRSSSTGSRAAPTASRSRSRSRSCSGSRLDLSPGTQAVA